MSPLITELYSCWVTQLNQRTCQVTEVGEESQILVPGGRFLHMKRRVIIADVCNLHVIHVKDSKQSVCESRCRVLGNFSKSNQLSGY